MVKKAEVFIGRTYWAKVSGRVVPVRIDSEARGKGWNATNTVSGRTVRILTAARLRGAYKTHTPTQPETLRNARTVHVTGLEGELGTLDGLSVRVRCDRSTGRVYWMEDWTKCHELEDRGIFRSVHHGADTFGHIDFYLKSIEEKHAV